MPIDGQVMFEVAPRFSGSNAKRQAEIIAEISPVLASTLASYGIDTRLRIAHFLGQTCHESAGFRTTEEFASGEAYEGRKDLGTGAVRTANVTKLPPDGKRSLRNERPPRRPPQPAISFAAALRSRHFFPDRRPGGLFSVHGSRISGCRRW